MVGKNPLLVDRRIYCFKGKWKNPNNDFEDNIYYFISGKPTFVADFKNGREQLSTEMEITCYGEHAFCSADYFYLQDGTQLRIEGVSNNYMEHNIAVRDLLKQRIESQTLILR